MSNSKKKNKLFFTHLNFRVFWGGLVFFSTFFLLNVKNISACTIELKVSDAIGIATLDAYQRAKKEVTQKSCSSLLLLINTPGGALQTTRLIVEEIINSSFPVLCLVYPSGGHAGSAGAIILQACHVAGAMVATNIGAATPILSTGQKTPSDLRKKIINDTRSWIEGIVKLRERNLDFARDIVTKAKAVSASEAKKIGAIDFLVKSKKEFLKRSESKTVKIKNNQKTKVKVGDLKPLALGFRYKVISILMDPQTAYLIFMGSIGLLYFEITHPGAIVPGVLGAMGLIISFVSLHKLNVKWGGLLLILLAFILMLLEVFVPSFGFLGLGGVVSFVLGSVFLFDPTSGYSVPLSTILPTALLLGLFVFLIAYLAFSTRNLKKSGDYDVLVGKEALVVSVSDRNKKEGMAEVNGEIWKIKSKDPLNKEDLVVVSSFQGLRLMVKKIKNEG